MKPQDFYTRARANEGVRVELTDGDGNPTGAWLLVRGLDSDAYRSAHDSYQRAMVRLAAAVRTNGSAATLPQETAEEREAAAFAERVALVIDWNLEAPCTPEAVAELFREAPYLSDRVFFVANDRDRFLGIKSATSIAGQSTNSASPSQPQPEPTTP